MSSKQNKSVDNLAKVSEDQAPIIPFAPYAINPEMEGQCSSSLLEKSNALAASIWGTAENYAVAKCLNSWTRTAEEQAVVDQNKKYFTNYLAESLVEKAIAFPVSSLSDAAASSFTITQKVLQLIEKIKRLEKRHEADEIIDDEGRRRIIEYVLFPTHSYGIYQSITGMRLDLRYPMQKAVVNELLTQDDMLLIESTINYIVKLRDVMTEYRPYSVGYEEEELLTPVDISNERYYTNSDYKRLLTHLKNLRQFFNTAVPYQIVRDHLPELAGQSECGKRYDELQKTSSVLRNTAIGYIQEQKPLSELMEKIVDLQYGLRNYFIALTHEINSGFQYLNRISLPFDKLVKESKQAIDDSHCPF